MKQKSGPDKAPADQVLKDIRVRRGALQKPGNSCASAHSPRTAVSLPDLPMSRLSKRITPKPRAASAAADVRLRSRGSLGWQRRFAAAQKGFARVDRSSATVWYGPITSEAWQALVTDRRGRRWPTRAAIPLSSGRR